MPNMVAHGQEDEFERIWTEKATEFTPDVENVVDVLREKGHPDLYVAAGFNQLHVWFGTRPMGRPRFAELCSLELEEGAEATFVCQEGVVHGFRRPFYPEGQPVPFEPFAEFGPPQEVKKKDLANSVADFLQWAAVGAGRGSRPLARITAYFTCSRSPQAVYNIAGRTFLPGEIFSWL